MASKQQQQERRRHERMDPASQAASEARRQRIIGAVTAGILLTATVVAVVIAASASDDPGSASAEEGAFGTHYDGLEQRRLAAGVPTMSDAAGGDHIHPRVSVYAGGEQVPIPVNIGIDPSQPPELMAGLHTHDPSGLIHVENAVDPTLGQFFEVWGVPFSADRLGPYEAEGNERVRMWVDGQPSREFGDLVLEDGQEVVVAYGTDAQLPPGLEE